jgi:hypothetical protein
MEVMMNSKIPAKQSAGQERKTLAEWRASRVHDDVLPSGLEVKLRDVTLTDLLFTGKLPPAFAEMAEKASKGSGSVDLKELFKNAADFAQMLDALVGIALVEPRIGETADDEHITLAELPNDDKMHIFRWANREVSQLQSFREG